MNYTDAADFNLIFCRPSRPLVQIFGVCDDDAAHLGDKCSMHTALTQA